MKILYVTMGGTLQVVLRLHEQLQAFGHVEPPAIYAADSINYRSALVEFPELTRLETLKEWDLTLQGHSADPDMERLRSYQSRFEASLWNALLADRRIFFGPLCKSKQDYRSRYTERQMVGILDVFLTEIDRFLGKTRPDFVLSFGTATLGDYVFELLAKNKDIPFRQLKPTKIRNLVSLSDTGIGVSSLLAARVRAHEAYPEDVRAAATDYIDSVRRRGVKYEGAILFSRKRMLRRLLSSPRHLAAALYRSMKIRSDPVFSRDNHIPPPFRTAFLTHVVHPVRTFSLGRRIDFIGSGALAQFGDFLFYPMHFEPEVSLQVFGKPFQNQIELIRNLALSVPIGMRILVKEHPRSLGFRKESYYRRILEIPNVRLVDPFVPTIEIVRRARLVAVVSGSVGLEAIVLGKPLLVFGKTPYGLLPSSMVAQVRDLTRLDQEINSILKSYRFDEGELVNYLSSIVSDAVPLDLYTSLLRKEDRYSESGSPAQYSTEYRRLAEFLHGKMAALYGQRVSDNRKGARA